jgi:hypothetical protein
LYKVKPLANEGYLIHSILTFFSKFSRDLPRLQIKEFRQLFL